MKKILIPKEKDLILIDYYDRTVGTEEKQAYFEILLYTYDDKKLLMEAYENGGSENEIISKYLVPHKVFDEINEIIKKYKMNKWNDIDGKCIDGRINILKFYDGKDLIRVSSDNMSEDGTKAFAEIYNELNEYRIKDYLFR